MSLLVGRRVVLLVDGSPSSGLERGDLCLVIGYCEGRCAHRPAPGEFVHLLREDGAEGNHFERQDVNAVVE